VSAGPGPRISRRRALGALGGLGALALPAEWLGRGTLLAGRPASVAAGADPSPDAGPDGGDLGNLHGVVEWIAREHAPRLSFLDGRWASLEAWAREAREAVHLHHGMRIAPGPVRGETWGGRSATGSGWRTS